MIKVPKQSSKKTVFKCKFATSAWFLNMIFKITQQRIRFKPFHLRMPGEASDEPEVSLVNLKSSGLDGQKP